MLLVGCSLHASVVFGQSGWKAGAAKQCITPASPMWMSGYASRDKPAEGTLHDLWAKALVLEDAKGTRLVQVSLDLVGIGRDISRRICDSLAADYSLQRSQIALCTSHTHTGPVVGHNLGSMYFLNAEQQKQVIDYADFLVDSINKAVGTAIKDLQPASLSYGLGTTDFAVNRRNNREPDVPMLREKGELKGPIDHAVPVLAVRTADGELKAVSFGYACHATVLSFYQWSGDWPGFAQIEIEKRHPGTVALFVAGCGADQNPLPRRTVELAENYGRMTADAVDGVLAGEMKPVVGRIRHAYEEIDLALGELPSKEKLNTDTQSTNKYIVSRAQALLTRLEQNGHLDQTYPYPVQVWGIGDDARTVILGGEVVVDYSVRLRSEFADRDLWVAGYSNDVMAYIPSVRVLREGGYEGESSMIYYGLPTVWSERVEDHICETVHRLVKNLDAE
ncbi:MAG: neutral/alkaline non-lysosomal ceramidase N-terminal domain-containing protein [Planctomycetaceae bacterium]|nr:neutral/alkaline non-lysosomal ceramidase N-terminal domain-containing protein [Planctomycetaceae bacterium]